MALEFDEEQRRAIDLIARPRSACTSAEELSDAGVSVETLRALEESRILARWDRPDGCVWTLTPSAASAFGLALEENYDEYPHWTYAMSDPKQWSRKPIRSRGGDLSPHLPEQLVDHRPGPVEELLKQEVFDTDTGESKGEVPVTLWGHTIGIDRRLKP